MARVTFAGKRESFPLPTCRDEAQARERAAQLAELASRMGGVDRNLALASLHRIARAPAGQTLRANCILADKLIGGWRPIASRGPTVRTIGKRWTSLELHREYPDDIRDTSASAEQHRRVLEKYVYPIVGDVPLDVLTLDACDEVKRMLPGHLQGNTRRNVLRYLQRVLSIAVYPLRLIERHPLPKGWVPRPTARKAMSALYPENDAALMAYAEIPLCWRVLWGFLDREGARDGEAIRLTIGDFDLERGLVRVDKTKTKAPRAWALQPGTAAALRVWLRDFRPEAKPTDRMFVSEAGTPIPTTHRLPELLRSHLRAVGLEDSRPELFEHTRERQRMRVHDLRGTFVTISLATGRTEAWVAERTGHMSSEMINAYKRTAQTFEQLHVEALAPLVEAIPELRPRDETAPSAPPESGAAGGGKSQRKTSRSAKSARSLASAEFSQISFNDSARLLARERFVTSAFGPAR